MRYVKGEIYSKSAVGRPFAMGSKRSSKEPVPRLAASTPKNSHSGETDAYLTKGWKRNI